MQCVHKCNVQCKAFYVLICICKSARSTDTSLDNIQISVSNISSHLHICTLIVYLSEMLSSPNIMYSSPCMKNNHFCTVVSTAGALVVVVV